MFDMTQTLRQQANTIVSAAIGAVLPDTAVGQALENVSFPGRVILVAAGKATFSWPQLITALIGGAVALLIVPVLRKALHK